ncbi:MAG: hypothetical protein ACD_73C00774G0003 [uncultured bacterium]|nr:MAG: hypothetical protein ACD_73C00774G0003 [uncultured bacterium]
MAPFSSYCSAIFKGSKSSLITPKEGEAFFISAMILKEFPLRASSKFLGFSVSPAFFFKSDNEHARLAPANVAFLYSTIFSRMLGILKILLLREGY